MAELEGLAELEAALNRALKNIEGDASAGLAEVAQDLKGKSVQLAPIDTGDLRGSGYANPAAGGWEVGFSEPYALVQHERLDYQHPKGGQAKFLEQPFAENSERYIQHIADKAKGSLR